MVDTTRYMRVELPADYEKTERVTVYGTNNTEIEVSSDLLVTADEIPREGEGHTAEEYREVLKAIYDMDSVEREKAFGVDESVHEYLKDFSTTELIKKYRAYKNAPNTGEYWKNDEDGGMVVVRYVERGMVRYYRCNNGTSNCLSIGYFIENFTKTEYRSKYLEAFLEEMKEVGDTN